MILNGLAIGAQIIVKAKNALVSYSYNTEIIMTF